MKLYILHFLKYLVSFLLLNVIVTEPFGFRGLTHRKLIETSTQQSSKSILYFVHFLRYHHCRNHKALAGCSTDDSCLGVVLACNFLENCWSISRIIGSRNAHPRFQSLPELSIYQRIILEHVFVIFYCAFFAYILHQIDACLTFMCNCPFYFSLKDFKLLIITSQILLLV